MLNYGYQFSSASSPTRSLRSVAGAAASGGITLVVMQIRFFFCTGVIRSSGAHGIVRYAGWWKVGGNGNNSPLPVKGRVVCRSRYAGRSQGHRSRGASVEEPAPA